MKSSRLLAAPPQRYFVILVGHGSRQEGFQQAMVKVASQIQKDKRFSCVVCAYLEITYPSIQEAIEFCVKKGAKQIRILPYFILMGKHVQSDIPEIITTETKKYAGVKISLCAYLGYDEKIVALVKKRILQVK